MKNVKESLKKPSRESLPWVVWNWNGTISPALLLEQLSWLIDCGVGGIAIRPSRDMNPHYLSEEFLELFATVLRIAAKQGIGIRIADFLVYALCNDPQEFIANIMPVSIIDVLETIQIHKEYRHHLFIAIGA